MPAIVVPFRGGDGKRRLGALPEERRAAVALAMLADVLAACTAVGNVLVASSDAAAHDVAREHGAAVVEDPGGGQGAAVAAALGRVESALALVVNADVPCARAEDVEALARATGRGIAVVAAADGTTNALGLATPALFEPLYGPGSARRFRDLAARRCVDFVPAAIPNLAADVDSPADLARLEPRLGPRTRAALMPVRA